MTSPAALPTLLRPEDVADLLRVSRAAVYSMAERGQLPGVIRIGRRLRFDRAEMLRWLEGKRVSSPEEVRR